MLNKRSQKRIDIQILRAIAVSLVLIFHIRSQIMPNGYLGVDIFFFITGFVLFAQIKDLANSQRGTRFRHFRAFLSKRFKRLMPAFVICTIISLIILTLFASLSAHKAIANQALASLFFLGNLSAPNLSGNYFSPQPNPFLHYWSLSSEWQIYFLVPILIIVTKNLFRASLYKVFSFYLIFFSITWALFSISHSYFNYYSPLSRLWEFFLGILLGQHYYKAKYPASASNRIFSRILFLVAFLIIISPLELGTLLGQIIAAFFFVSFIQSGFSPSSQITNILVWIGDRSYSIYLYHLPLIYLSLYSPLSASRIHFRALGTLCSVALTFLLAHWSFTKIELREKISEVSLNKECWSRNGFFVLYYIICIVLSFSLSALSSVFYGPSQGSKVEVAWKKFPRCPISDVTPCISANKATEKKIVLVGDSHVDHFVGVMRELSTYANADIYFLGGKVESYIENTSFEKSLDKMDPNVVIVSQFNQNTTQIENFKRGLKRIQDKGIQILFIADNPHFSDYLQYIHYVNPSFTSLIFSSAPQDKVDSFELAKDSRIAPNAYLEVVKLLNVEYLDLFERFCPQNVCLRSFNGNYLFYDNHHLSVKGAEFVQAELIKKVITLLKLT